MMMMSYGGKTHVAFFVHVFVSMFDSYCPLQKLSYVDFSYACLKNVVFSRANLCRSQFQEVDAENTIFHDATMDRCDFTRANLRGALLAGANLESANLHCCRLCDADLRSAHLQWAKLTDVNLEGANLEKANLKAANLTGAKISKANLKGANLQGARLIGVKLEDTCLEGANLHEVIWWNDD
ncbi:hypothetical protein HanPI659440_Chr11g0436391 [Helianthus annuus]|nr:hypothetical protein HanPI659440_Chr11g0436391 [Helianthus annuus]